MSRRETGHAAALRSQRLLLAAALAPVEIARVAWQQWSSDFDLGQLPGDAYWILPLVYRNLAALDDAIPDRGRLAGVYKQMRMRKALALPRILTLVDELSRRDCRPLPGCGLSLVLAGEETLPVDGADLLVPLEAIGTADTLLARHGWRPLRPLPSEDLRAFFASARYRHEQAGDLVLAWRPFGPDGALADDASVWRRAVEVCSGGRPIAVPDPVDRLLMASRGGSLLKLCVALNRLQPQIDSAAVVARARELGMEAPWQAFAGQFLSGVVPGVPERLLSELELNAWLPPADDRIDLRELFARHRRRWRRCPAGRRPSGFVRYLSAYYRHAWQTGGIIDSAGTAIGRLHRAIVRHGARSDRYNA